VTIVTQILNKARILFDVAGITGLGDDKALIVLGLESTEERNLDDFGHENGEFRMYGFERHVQPRLEELIRFIRETGYSAKVAGRIGYPLQGEMNLKEAAIRIGIGKRGKSTVVLHTVYGPRLRFMGIITDLPCEVSVSDYREEENPVCRDCSICIDSCPVNALEPYRMPDPSICLSNISSVDDRGHSILCDICLKLSPAAKQVQS
jgi:epoxyqueuosine reductase QueG